MSWQQDLKHFLSEVGVFFSQVAQLSLTVSE